jgi:hypothetical protein
MAVMMMTMMMIMFMMSHSGLTLIGFQIVDFEGTRRKMSTDEEDVEMLSKILRMPSRAEDPISNSGILPPHTPARRNLGLQSADLQGKMRPVEPGPSCANLEGNTSLPTEDAGSAEHDRQGVGKRREQAPTTDAALGTRLGDRNSCEIQEADQAVRQCSV